MPLNQTQKYIISSLLEIYIEDILELNQSESLNAFNLVRKNEISLEEQTLLIKQDIWEDVKFIHRILNHPCPQNRSENYPYFGAPSDPNMIVYKNEHNQPAFEQKGLLGLTAWNDSNTNSLTKDDVVEYINQLIIAAMEKKKQELLIAPALQLQPGFFKDNANKEILTQIKTLLTEKELESLPIMAIVRLPTAQRLSFCNTVQEFRHKPKYGRGYLHSSNRFLDGVTALLFRGVSLGEFMSLNIKKQMVLAVEQRTWFLIEAGVDFKKLSQLEPEEISQIFLWLSDDTSKVTSMYDYRREKVAQEINTIIERKLNSHDDTLPNLY